MKAIVYFPSGAQKEIEVSNPAPKFLFVPTSGNYGLLNPPPLDENGNPEFPRIKFEFTGIVDGKAIYQ